MRFGVIFSALFSAIAATAAKDETFTYVGTYASTTTWTDAKFKAWTTTKQTAAASSTEKTAVTAEIVKIYKEINTRLAITAGTVFSTVTAYTDANHVALITASKVTKAGTTAAPTVTVTFTAKIQAGMNDATTTIAKIKAAMAVSGTKLTQTSLVRSAKTTYKIQALYASGKTWNAAYTNFANPLTIVFVATEMSEIATAVNAQIKTTHKDAILLTAKDVHVNKLIQKAAASGRKRRSTGTTNVQFTASIKATTGSTTTDLTKLIKAINTDSKTSGAVKGSAERMIASVTMTLFALGFYMF